MPWHVVPWLGLGIAPGLDRAAVAEFCGENCPVPVVRHGVNDEFGRSGKAPLALEAFGLSAKVIAEKAKKALAMKK